MMKPKLKAKELVESFMNIKQQKLADYSIIYYPTAKQCALIAVDEILEIINNITVLVDIEDDYDFYLKVKQEIEKL